MLRICHLSAEFTPFAKTGGLGDVALGLCRALATAGHDVRPFLPLYRTLALDGASLHAVDFLRDIHIRTGSHHYVVDVLATRIPGTETPLYLVRCPALYDRGGYYTNEWDEPVRFGVFSRAVIECCQRMGWSPDVVHCNDWHTALTPLYLRTHYSWDRSFARTRTLLAIHNIGYQGVFHADRLHDLDFTDHAASLHNDDLRSGVLNFMKTGIIWSTAVSTVSRTYAREIQTPEYGVGLDGMLRQRSDHLVGIVNGVDYTDWDPRTDPHIPFHYSADDLEPKSRNTDELLARLGLAPARGAPTVGVVSRLTTQKGFELLFDVMPRMLASRDMRFVILGSGEGRFEQWFGGLQEAFRGKVCFWRGYNEPLAHLIEAGSDVFVMPSRFEPCGLNQMYSLRYGTVPVVRRTGGLADTVEPYAGDGASGTGFVFEHYTATGLQWALSQALDLHADRERWQALMRRGMSRDFSWERQAGEYVRLYRSMINEQ